MSALLIQNLDQFLDSLNYIETGIFTYEEIMESAEISADDLKEDQISWSPSHVTQNKIQSNGDCEVVVRGWEANQEIELPGDPRELVYVIEGNITTDGNVSVGKGLVTEINTPTKITNSDLRGITLHLVIK